jgi:hypothetical protein
MSSSASDLAVCVYAATVGRCLGRCRAAASPSARHYRTDPRPGGAQQQQQQRRRGGRAEVELQPRRAPPPPPRVNFILLQGKPTTLAALEKHDKEAAARVADGKVRALEDDPVCAICLSDLEPRQGESARLERRVGRARETERARDHQNSGIALKT